MENNYLTYKEMEIQSNQYVKASIKCKCGHPIVISNKKGVAECTWCHRNVYKDKATEFKYKMKEKLIKERRILR